MRSIPEQAKVVIIGGGPAGALTAILLAREGIDCVLFEREKFPRYHIGESLLTSALPILDFVGLRKIIDKHGFIKKRGAFFRIKHDLDAGYVDFTKGKYKYSYQVIRSEFDELVLAHAKKMGAHVFEETAVEAVAFQGERPVEVTWRCVNTGRNGRTRFHYLVDASGLSGLLATKYLHNRKFQESFSNVAIGNYWKNFKLYRDHRGIGFDTDFYAEALKDGSGWTWVIPLHKETLSVGVTVHVNTFKRLRKQKQTKERVYRELLSRTAIVRELLADATPCDRVRVWQDYSYVADTFSGPYFRLAGDAAGFIDPLFSTGVHLAFLGGLSAAASICSSIRDELPEDDAAAFHNSCVRNAYSRFLLIVTGIYSQILNQKHFVLKEINREGLQHTFDRIQPVVSGQVDISGKSPSKETLNQLKAFEYLTVKRPLTGSPDIAAQKEHAIDGRYIRLKKGKLGITSSKRR